MKKMNVCSSNATWYLYPSVKRRGDDPNTFEWISSKGLLVFIRDEWKDNSWPSPYWQVQQNLLAALLLICDLWHLLSIWWSTWWEECLSLLCQILKSLDWTFKEIQLFEKHWGLKTTWNYFMINCWKMNSIDPKRSSISLFIWVILFIP